MLSMEFSSLEVGRIFNLHRGLAGMTIMSATASNQTDSDNADDLDDQIT